MGRFLCLSLAEIDRCRPLLLFWCPETSRWRWAPSHQAWLAVVSRRRSRVGHSVAPVSQQQVAVVVTCDARIAMTHPLGDGRNVGAQVDQHRGVTVGDRRPRWRPTPRNRSFRMLTHVPVDARQRKSSPDRFYGNRAPHPPSEGSQPLRASRHRRHGTPRRAELSTPVSVRSACGHARDGRSATGRAEDGCGLG
jgi:hypothetical protein